MTSAGRRYLAEIAGLLAQVEADGWEQVSRAAALVAGTVEAGGLIHVFGTGHSHLLAEELFYRAGGLAQVNPILVDPLMLHSGAARSTRLERVPGLAAALLADEPVGPDDLMVVASNSGGNATGVEMVLAARELGLPTIALTSVAHATAAAARAGAGPRLHELADVVLDNHGRPGDAAVVPAGSEVAVSPTSTVVGAAILNAVVAEAVELLLARGVVPDVFASSNLAGGDETNRALLAAYGPRVRSL
jgi:uncharacterized phosphosugar-binding protein